MKLRGCCGGVFGMAVQGTLARVINLAVTGIEVVATLRNLVTAGGYASKGLENI
jgi:hypothetical protein